MELRNLSRLQIRAEVMMMLQQLEAYDEIPKYEHDKYIAQLKSIENLDHILEILVKELPKSTGKKAKIIGFFLTEIGELEKLKEPLWAYITTPNISDEIKDIASLTLRALGDETNPEEYLSYLEDPQQMIDNETQRLLEVASFNPEAQIDFLDFLFSLPDAEQKTLIDSLKSDYPPQYIANVTIPALSFKPSAELQQLLIELLGETKSPEAVPVLSDILQYSKNDILKKSAKKSLNMLKLTGIDIEASKEEPGSASICEMSKPYECYVNHIDGTGNQGIIFSRIKPNKDILMFSTVINDRNGVLSCFGFNGITKNDYRKIVQRFEQGTICIEVSAEYCKYRLKNAELINKTDNCAIPYEYSAWKSLMADITLPYINHEETAAKCASRDMVLKGNILYRYPDFKYWFLDDTDNSIVAKFLSSIIDKTLNENKNLINTPEALMNWFQEEISLRIPDIFNDNISLEYKKRLFETAYLFEIQELYACRDMAYSTALALEGAFDFEKGNIPFLQEFMKKTLLEGFLRYRHNLNEPENIKQIDWKKAKTDNKDSKTDNKALIKDLDKVINILNKALEKKIK